MNIYMPYIMKVVGKRLEAPNIYTLKLKFKEEKDEKNFSFKLGQFGEYGIFGLGESTFCIASAPSVFEKEKYFECTFRNVGKVTSTLAKVNEGEEIGFRGPYGTVFPLEELKGKNIVFASGGIALPPLRGITHEVLNNKNDYGSVLIVYGARTAEDFVYKDELQAWEKINGVKLIKTVDKATEGYNGIVGLFPNVMEEEITKDKKFLTNTVYFVAGPPIVIDICLNKLSSKGISLNNIYTTLENKMKCGLGKCGRCNVGSVYVCKDGPVFDGEQVKKMLNDF